MLTNNYISVFKNVWEKKPAGKVPIVAFCEQVMNGEYKTEIETLRKESDPAKRKVLKKHLPGLTISGTFSKRNKESLIKHSGFVCIDIDPEKNPT